jgi:photosystem II stability/assembly factor-like uncharacterized protein
MKTLLQILVLSVVISSGSNQLMAQWVQTSGPEGGRISGFANIDTNLFAGTLGGGVFLSTDNGTSWTPVNNGLWATSVLSIAVSGTNLFVGTDGAGVFRSTDNGNSWTPANTGLTNGIVSKLLVIGTNLFAGTYGGVFRSTDNGVGWAPVNNGLTDTVVYSLAVHGTDLFAGTAGGVFFPADSGLHWTAAGLTNQEIHALTVSGTYLFAGAGGGVFRSSDKGANWDSVNTTFADVRALTVSDTNLFAGGWMVSWSSNNGDSWTNISNGLWGTERVNALAVNGTYLYTGHRGTSVWRLPLSDIITSVKDVSGESPEKFSLAQNYPNPFNSTTTFEFYLPNSEFVILKIYNILGEEVVTLVSKKLAIGKYKYEWDTGSLASGIYFYRIQAGNYVGVKKMVLMK